MATVVAMWWPKGPGDGVAEPAIAFIEYGDTLEIKQRDAEILIAWEDVPEFIRELRTVYRDKVNRATRPAPGGRDGD